MFQKNGILSYTNAGHLKTRTHRIILPETLFYMFKIMSDKKREQMDLAIRIADSTAESRQCGYGQY
jgi:hypothetical protein